MGAGAPCPSPSRSIRCRRLGSDGRAAGVEVEVFDVEGEDLVGPGDGLNSIRQRVFRAATRRGGRALERLADCELGSESYRRAVIGELARLLTVDAWCFTLLDPTTLLPSSPLAEDNTGVGNAGLASRQRRFFELEYRESDLVTMRSRYRRGAVEGLSASTGGDLARSVRWRDVFEPRRSRRRLRTALSYGGACWGHLSLYRDRGQRRFTGTDATTVARLARLVARGLRRAWVLPGEDTDCFGDGPVTLLLDADLHLLGSTPSARHWLSVDQRPTGWPSRLPPALYALAARLDAASAARTTDASARLRLRTASGAWLVISRPRLDGAAGHIAITIEMARTADVLPLLTQPDGLSPRERQIFPLVLDARSTRDVAAALYVSQHTVHDHLKSIFRKVGVSSRTQLASRLLGRDPTR